MTTISKKKPQIYEFDNFQLDAVKRQLLRDGESVPLPSKAFDLLLVLIENNERVVGKEELYMRVWADQIVEESNLTVQMSAIRKALGEPKQNPRYIVTIPGRGYRFVGAVANWEDGEVVIETQTLTRVVIEREEEDDNGLRLVKGESALARQAEMRTLSQEESLADSGSGTAAAGATVNALPVADAKSLPRRRAVLFLTGGLILALVLAGGFGFWSYSLQQRTHERPAAIPFAEMKIKQLTTKGKVGWAVISPDGEFYAYGLNERGEFKTSLWLGQTDGGKDIQLRPPDDNLVRGLAFSPDGKTLYFTVANSAESKGGLFKMPVLGGVAEKLLDDVRFFALSRDGKQVGFFRPSNETNLPALVIANLDGTGERQLLTRPMERDFSSRAPAWSPDGSMLAFAAVNDTAKRSEEVFTVRVSDGYLEKLTGLDWIRINNLVWHSDGHGFTIVATDKNEATRHLWVIDTNGNAHRISSDTDTYGLSLSISTDGNSLMAVQIRRESNLWVAPSDEFSRARQVTFSSINGVYGWHGLDWMPDNRIVFTAGIDRTFAIHSIDADGSNIRQLTSAGFWDRRPNVAAGGRFIIFQSNRSGSNEIWRVNADGNDLTQLTMGGGNTDPHSTPDGKWVVYISNRDGRQFIWRIPIEGGEPVQVTDKYSLDPRVSHEGKLVACGYRADDKSPLQLAVVSSEDGNPIKLFDIPRSANFSQGIRWTPDDKAVCYRDLANGIWRQDLNGGPPQRVKGLPEEEITNFGWSVDGKLFAFALGRAISDVVLIKDSSRNQ